MVPGDDRGNRLRQADRPLVEGTAEVMAAGTVVAVLDAASVAVAATVKATSAQRRDLPGTETAGLRTLLDLFGTIRAETLGRDVLRLKQRHQTLSDARNWYERNSVIRLNHYHYQANFLGVLTRRA